MEKTIANMKFNELCDYIDLCFTHGHTGKFLSLAIARRNLIQGNI